MKITEKIAVLALAGLASVSVMAAPGAAVDVTDVTGTIAAQLVPIGLVGAAVLGITVAIKAYKWVRRAM
jgi:uncharacterized membrane protein